MGINLPFNNFTSGEIDELLLGRFELPVVQAGLLRAKNAIPLKNGGVRRIPGTYFPGYAYSNGTVPARDIPFSAKSGSYIVELTNLKARIWNSAHTVVQYSAVDLELTTTITTAELFEVQAKVINNELWLVHHAHKPQKIAETSPQPFTLSEPVFTGARTFSAAGDFPSVVAAYRGSILFGATDNEPATYFMSRAPVAATGSYRLTDFTLGANPDDAIVGFNTDGLGSRILWLQAHRRVAAGMTHTVWADATGFPSAANFYMHAIGFRGAAAIQAALLGNSIFYIGAPAPTLQMLVYSDEAGGFTDIEISRYSNHLLQSGIQEMAVMNTPEGGQAIVMPRADGGVAFYLVDATTGSITVGGCKYEAADGGLVQSAAPMRTATGDELWMVVKRGTKYCQEWLKFPTDRDADFTELHYVDSGIRWTGVATNTVSGLSHLEGKTVHAIADGSSMPAKVVTGGAVTYDKTFTKIHIGLPNESLVTPARPELQANLTWQGKKKKVNGLVLRIFNSYGGKVAAGRNPQPGDYQVIPYTGGPFQPFGQAPQPVTTDVVLDVHGDIDLDGVVTIKQDEPFPMTILAVVTDVQPEES